jgi:hypothetical protein
MDGNMLMPDELVDALEAKGKISISDGMKELFIQTLDDKEGYSYVSSTNNDTKTYQHLIYFYSKAYPSSINILNNKLPIMVISGK